MKSSIMANQKCSICKFFNRKRVFSHKNLGMCENRKSNNHKMIKDKNDACKDLKSGKFSKRCIIFLNR